MIINEGLPDTLINKPDRWLYKVELLLSIVFLTVHSTTLAVLGILHVDVSDVSRSSDNVSAILRDKGDVMGSIVSGHTI